MKYCLLQKESFACTIFREKDTVPSALRVVGSLSLIAVTGASEEDGIETKTIVSLAKVESVVKEDHCWSPI
jgi:hypothetical protein